MGYQRIINNLVKVLDKEATDKFAEEELTGTRMENQCTEFRNSLYCTLHKGHNGPHIATIGSRAFKHLWQNMDTPLDRTDAMGLVIKLIEIAAVEENVNKIKEGRIRETQCREVEHCWVCTRPKDHTGAHIALRDRDTLLNVWVVEA